MWVMVFSFDIAESSPIRLFDPYISIYRMVKTIRVSEEYHEWLSAHKKDDETMEETLRRMTRGPHPSDVAGLIPTAMQSCLPLQNMD